MGAGGGSGVGSAALTGAVQATMLNAAVNLQASTISTLLQAIPQTPQLATSGSLGTRVNTYA